MQVVLPTPFQPSDLHQTIHWQGDGGLHVSARTTSSFKMSKTCLDQGVVLGSVHVGFKCPFSQFLKLTPFKRCVFLCSNDCIREFQVLAVLETQETDEENIERRGHFPL